MEQLKCLSCGSTELVKYGSCYVCPYCRSNYYDRDEQEFIEKLNRMILFFDDKRYRDAHSLSVEILSKQPNNTLAEYYRVLSYSTFDSVICLDDDAEALQKALWAYQQRVGNSSSYFIFAANQARAFINMSNYVAERHNYGRVTTVVTKKPATPTEPGNVSDGIAFGAAAGAAYTARSAIKMVTGSSILGALGGAAAGAVGGAIVATVSAVGKAKKSQLNTDNIPEIPETIVTVRQEEMDKIAKCLIGAVHILYKPVRNISQATPQFFNVQTDLVNLAERLGNRNFSQDIGNLRAFIAANRNIFGDCMSTQM